MFQGIQELTKDFASHKAWLVFIHVSVSRQTVVSVVHVSGHAGHSQFMSEVGPETNTSLPST